MEKSVKYGHFEVGYMHPYIVVCVWVGKMKKKKKNCAPFKHIPVFFCGDQTAYRHSGTQQQQQQYTLVNGIKSIITDDEEELQLSHPHIPMATREHISRCLNFAKRVVWRLNGVQNLRNHHHLGGSESYIYLLHFNSYIYVAKAIHFYSFTFFFFFWSRFATSLNDANQWNEYMRCYIWCTIQLCCKGNIYIWNYSKNIASVFLYIYEQDVCVYRVYFLGDGNLLILVCALAFQSYKCIPLLRRARSSYQQMCEHHSEY